MSLTLAGGYPYGMGVDSVHPQYAVALPDWNQLRDAKRGSRAVKDKDFVYLPATAGMTKRGLGAGQPGRAQYDAYKCRALFPEFVDDTITIFVGLLNAKPAVITLPERLEPMRENATACGETLDQLLRRIHDEQLSVGRYGLLLEAPDGQPAGEAMPFIATYAAERIRNWDNGQREQGAQLLELVVLEETEAERGSDFAWTLQDKYRVLALENQIPGLSREEQAEAGAGDYVVAVLSDGNASVTAGDFTAPQIGGQTLQQIPFVFINSNDIITDVDKPPLLGMSELAFTVYRGEADYRQALFAQGQDTLVVVGGDEEATRNLGVGASIELPIGGSAEFIGVDSKGLPEMRAALENDRKEASRRGAHLLDTDGGAGAESGEALKVRVAAKTPTLTSIARTGAGGLEAILKIAAEWVGANPDEVHVEPNMQFVAMQITPRELIELQTAKSLGAPITQEDIHNWLAQREFTRNTFEENAEILEGEAAAATEADAGAVPPVNPDED